MDLTLESAVCFVGSARGRNSICVCVYVRLQEVYAAPLRFLSDAVYDDPWSRHLMSILAPLQYMKVAVHLKL